MSKVETVSLRIFGRDLTLACPPKEKDNLIKAAKLFNEELDNINDKNNALIIAGLTLANKLLSSDTESSKVSDLDFSELINKIEKAIGTEGKAIVKNANIGFCEFFWFKCAGARACDAWVGGGPLK